MVWDRRDSDESAAFATSASLQRAVGVRVEGRQDRELEVVQARQGAQSLVERGGDGRQHGRKPAPQEFVLGAQRAGGLDSHGAQDTSLDGSTKDHYCRLS
ncbi:hypothetical protein GCM10025876_09910 [Demequina litorisediminis]|uniref:Uncharacterized protein n=1 Tax=Demequina litorisediminis TaxID=1849022 RepID=A0ABQ6IC83_9MICO|nr:hypothetical protein GCM10025876_09910 [Demequina litorisediminis]